MEFIRLGERGAINTENKINLICMRRKRERESASVH